MSKLTTLMFTLVSLLFGTGCQTLVGPTPVVSAPIETVVHTEHLWFVGSVSVVRDWQNDFGTDLVIEWADDGREISSHVFQCDETTDQTVHYVVGTDCLRIPYMGATTNSFQRGATYIGLTDRTFERDRMPLVVYEFPS